MSKTEEMRRSLAANTAAHDIMHSSDEGAGGDMMKRLAARRNQRQQTGLLPVGWERSMVGLRPPEQVTEREYADVGTKLLHLAGSMQWLLGDWINIGDHFQYGETYQRLAEETNYSEKTLRDYAYVCRNVDLSIRIDKLSFGHHQAVVSMDRDEQVKWLDHAARNNLSISALRKAIKQAQLPATTPWGEKENPLRQGQPEYTRDRQYAAGDRVHIDGYGSGKVQAVVSPSTINVELDDGTLLENRLETEVEFAPGPGKPAGAASSEPYIHEMGVVESRQFHQWAQSVERLLADYVHHPDYNPEAYSYQAYSLKIVREASAAILANIPENEFSERMHDLEHFTDWMLDERQNYGMSQINRLRTERERIARKHNP